MDKVIIDGVDVSGCEFYQIEANELYPKAQYCGSMRNTFCENEPDCYYKQLQRAKAEIEELKKQVKNNETAYHTELGTYNMECGNLLEENKNLIEENERLKEEKSKLLSKCIDKQCRINELQQICAIKEFSLKVNGKEYKNLSGIDKAKLFINNENAIRDRYIQKLENKMPDLQYKFYENCKKVVDVQKQIDKYCQALQEIRAMVDCANCEYESNGSCNPQQCSKIETKINEVIGAE